MKNLAIAATLLALATGPVFAQSAAIDMLENNVANTLTKIVPNADLSNVTLGDLVLIKGILDGGDDRTTQRSSIKRVIAKADAR